MVTQPGFSTTACTISNLTFTLRYMLYNSLPVVMDIENSLMGGLAFLIKTDVDPKAKAKAWVLASSRA